MARVLVIRQYYFPLDIRVRREVEALLSAGHEVDVLCLKQPHEPARERWHGARILRVPLRHRRNGPMTYLVQYAVFGLIAGALAALLHLRRRYELVQVNSLPDVLVFAALAPKSQGARVLLDLHETMPEFFSTRLGVPMQSRAVRLVAAAEQASIRFADHVITCTEDMRQAFIARGAPPDKIGVVLNSADESIFDVERFAPKARDDGKFVLISHGSIEERYGIDTTIRALALLADEMPGLRLEVYGRGSYRDQLVSLARELHVLDRVSFQEDWVPMEDLVGALSRADVGVVAINRDAFRDLTHCNKMYELITMRRPVILSRTRSVQSYFDEGCFAWFDAGDPADLARAISLLHRDPVLGDRLVRRAAERNEPYRWPRQRERYLGAVARALCPAIDWRGQDLAKKFQRRPPSPAASSNSASV